MRKLEKLQLVRNVSSNWVALVSNILVGIFLSPFILHRLGDAAFGIWVLIFSITGYYGLFDLGIRSSVVRYVSKAKATGDLNYASKVISTSLFSYTCIGVFAFLITVLVTVYVNRFFHVDEPFQSRARWLLLMVGSAVALGFPLGVSSGILEGLQKFDVLGWTSIASTLVRAALVVAALHHGYGLLMTAFITVTLPLLSSLVRTAVAARLLPIPLGMKYVDRATVREMAGYSGTMLIMIVSARLRFKSDSIIIGTFLSSVAITYFNIGSRIVDYAGEVVESLAQIFVPMSSHSHALGDMDRLKKIFVAGNRFCAFTIFPICAILIILGRSVIETWVGKRYVAQSYPVLLILLVPTTLMLAQAASGRVLLGMSRHRTWAMVTLIEALRDCGRRHRDSGAACGHGYLLFTLASLPGIEDSNAHVLAGSLSAAYHRLFPAGDTVAATEGVVRTTQLLATGNSARGGGNSLRTFVNVGIRLKTGHEDRQFAIARSDSGSAGRGGCWGGEALAGNIGSQVCAKP